MIFSKKHVLMVSQETNALIHLDNKLSFAPLCIRILRGIHYPLLHPRKKAKVKLLPRSPHLVRPLSIHMYSEISTFSFFKICKYKTIDKDILSLIGSIF